eukprot:gene22321-42587_t
MNWIVGPPQSVVGARLTSVHSKDVEDAVYALFGYAAGFSGQLETNWSDEAHRKMSTSITVYGTNGKIHADRQECQVFMKPGHSVEGYPSGWTIKYITELQGPVSFYLRGRQLRGRVQRAEHRAAQLVRQRVRDRLDDRPDHEGERGVTAMDRILFGDNQFFG